MIVILQILKKAIQKTYVVDIPKRINLFLSLFPDWFEVSIQCLIYLPDICWLEKYFYIDYNLIKDFVYCNLLAID